MHFCYCRCGFAQSQDAYDNALNGLFTTLEVVEDHLTTSRYLCGDTLTLADVCLFTTLIRFDAVYNVLFKCTKKKLIEYPNLHGYLRDIYQVVISILIYHPGLASQQQYRLTHHSLSTSIDTKECYFVCFSSASKDKCCAIVILFRFMAYLFYFYSCNGLMFVHVMP